MPAVCVYPMRLHTKFLARVINTMEVKIINSDSSGYIPTELEQEYAVTS